jgi:hypothetical protein
LKPSVLVFARKADDGLASLAGKLDKVVAQNADKKACATVVLLAKKDDVAKKLEEIAKEKKLEKVPLTVSKDEAKGPEDYNIPKDTNVMVVVYDKSMEVTQVLTFDKLDDKAIDDAVKAFEKVLVKKDEKK